jgi:hypothetical protein
LLVVLGARRTLHAPLCSAVGVRTGIRCLGAGRRLVA